MIFVTSNSTYEVEHDLSRIRRLVGSSNPTPRQGKDGEWRTYEAISPIEIGTIVLIVWSTTGSKIEGTKTSPVQHIIEALN